jgi:hypothetical protein
LEDERKIEVSTGASKMAKVEAFDLKMDLGLFGFISGEYAPGPGF